ncbi:hypothetical protein AVEN_214673-1 [Araneus ventricosus]|uniref:Uncharacterized protein n=1 Tax=Araneus ventricosus TaxID=182803 RepID=A0A4Y2K8M1_ARAVE|nr:hypothetical protein AVEN_214673-1 [Araneus ventricosus]
MNIVANIRSVGVWWKESNRQDNGERMFIHKYAGKTKHRRQEQSQQITSYNSNSTWGPATQTARKSRIMTVTELSIALSSPAIQLPLQTQLQSRSSFRLHRLYTVARLVVTSHEII